MVPSSRPSMKFLVSNVELAMAKQATAFGAVLLETVAAQRAHHVALVRSALASVEAAAGGKDALEAIEQLVPQGEVFGRALAFITGVDPETLGQAFVDADVQITVVPHGTAIPERLVREEAILLDPFGHPIGKS
jgi:hypothetical protein